MKGAKVFIAIALLILAVAWLAGLFTSKTAPGQSDEETRIPVDTLTLEREESTRYEEVPATINARETTLIAARIMARIEKMAVDSGDRVQRGDLLVSLEQDDLQSRVAQAESQQASIQANLTEAEQNLQRTRELTERGALARADLDRAQARRDSLAAQLKQAGQQIEEARSALSYSEIRAPIDGRVVERFAEPGDTTQPGQRLLSIYNPQTLRVEANVRESLALTLTDQEVIRVHVPAVNRSFDSHLEEITPASNPGSRTFLIKSALIEQDRLMPGMFARLQVPAGSEQALWLPERYMAHLGQLTVAWVYRENEGLERRILRLGRRNGERREVLAGLSAGETVVPPPVGGEQRTENAREGDPATGE
ncbi:MAG: efflux RND transporter periplasmic adaptor subunit [Pseudomonadota bacterium]